MPDLVTKRSFTSLFGDLWLRVRVHCHAFIREPRLYIIAAWWRLLGKRLRARGQFAPLLALSPLAYRLSLLGWKSIDLPDIGDPPIIALVQVGQDKRIQDETLQSLARESIEAQPLAALACEDIARIISQARLLDDVWLMPLADGDVLARGAGAAYRLAAAGTKSDVIYADDDLIDRKGRRDMPHFKPGWNAELFRHFDFLTGSCIVRASLVVGEMPKSSDWAEEMVAAAIPAAGPPLHLAMTLHHRRSRPSPRVPAALAEPKALPSVSVIVPTRNRVDLLRTTLEGLARTDYANVEVIVVDNDSDDAATLVYLASLASTGTRVMRVPGPFNFSKLNNQAVAQASGQLLCLLNNDIEVLEPGWLRIMAIQAMRPEVGAVGAQLLYPDGRIQHAGVVLGVGEAAAHSHRLVRPDDEGYFRRHALPQFVSAVTAACLVVQRARYNAVNGLDEENFAVAFNDVDLCMRLGRRGWQSLYEPRAVLIHHESVSRGFDRDPISAARFAGEMAALKARWGTDRVGVDPFHHIRLSRFSERFALQL